MKTKTEQAPENKRKIIQNKKQLLVRINYFKLIGEKILESAFLLAQQDKFSKVHIYSFNLLISQAIEILGKSLVAVKVLSDNSKLAGGEINEKLKSLGHKLDKIFEELPEVKQELMIKNIELHKTQFLNEYFFEVNKNKIIRIKDLESARYSSLASSKDVSVTDDRNCVLPFLRKYRKKIDRLYNEYKSKIKK